MLKSLCLCPLLSLPEFSARAAAVAGDGRADFAGTLRTIRETGVRYQAIEGSGRRHPLRYLEESFNRVSTLSALPPP